MKEQGSNSGILQKEIVKAGRCEGSHREECREVLTLLLGMVAQCVRQAVVLKVTLKVKDTGKLNGPL